ncbi:ribose-phosphate diphosphokinase [Chlamydia caviae]|uniref:ribose-phosphate diphosphokinase n=1 Tax=Chlamydia caviae (strain ATCC VR-813 / DSM 19441 / 03DC25 / GPIC) TaxID=227941 RepID=Q822W0_CHLCV|nr:ribose-phosphate diphosphokinase [Chlamydia caviae]AAP05311.1 ribose-phosphate pyrophosphokinase [Chlamydia caviae GPIC]
MNKQPILLSGSSNLILAQNVCAELKIKLGRMELNQFPDGETHVKVLEDVRGRDVFIMQSIVGQPNHYLFELLIIADALKRSSAKSITAIIPYLGYCRQDRRNKTGEPITAKLVADVLTTAGITNLITCDLHADQIEGFYKTHVDHLHCQQLFVDTIKSCISQDCIAIAPDIGSIKIAERIARMLDTGLAVIKKERLNSFEVSMQLIGEVQDKNVVIIDDLCSTANTLVEAANLCKQKGAKKIIATVTHGLFVGDAIQKIETSALESLFVTDTIHLQSTSTCIKTLSTAPMIASAIKAALSF